MTIELDSGRDNFLGALVSVAWNRHKKLWSIRMGSKVVAYTNELLLSGVTFVVHEAGRQRAILTGKRNVHAFARGILRNFGTAPHWPNVQRVSYNPFTGPTFFYAESGEPIYEASWVVARNGMFVL